MELKDFSIRYEVEVMLEDMGVKMTPGQINDVMYEIELHDTFLGVVGLFIARGIKEIAEKEKIEMDEREIQHQLRVNRESINYDDL